MKEIILCTLLYVLISFGVIFIFERIRLKSNEFKIIDKYIINNTYNLIIQKIKHKSTKMINVTLSKNDYELLDVGDKIIINI